MLVRTGFRLAAPQEFVHMYKIGREQLIIFVSTIVGVLATDLLSGIGIGIAVKVLLHLFNGVPPLSFFRLRVNVEQGKQDGVTVAVKDSAIFSTWIGLKKRLERVKEEAPVVLDLSETYFVDHTVMERLKETENEFKESNSTLVIAGLDNHTKVSDYPTAAMKRSRG